MTTTTLVMPQVKEKPIFTEKLLTGDEALGLGIDQPFDLVDGRIVYTDYVGDAHGILESELVRHLKNFNATRKLGWVLSGEVGVYTRYEPDIVRGVDVVFVSRKRLSTPSGKALKVVPELVVEIISPNDRWSEIRSKIVEYFVIGVERVWVVEPATKTILVYRTPTECTQLAQPETLCGDGILEGFELPLNELFADLP